MKLYLKIINSQVGLTNHFRDRRVLVFGGSTCGFKVCSIIHKSGIDGCSASIHYFQSIYRTRISNRDIDKILRNNETILLSDDELTIEKKTRMLKKLQKKALSVSENNFDHKMDKKIKGPRLQERAKSGNLHKRRHKMTKKISSNQNNFECNEYFSSEKQVS